MGTVHILPVVPLGTTDQMSPTCAAVPDPHALQVILVDELAELPDAGVTSEAYDDGEYIGATLTFTDVPIERIEEATSGGDCCTDR